MQDSGIVKTVQSLLSFNFLTCKMRTLKLDTVAEKDYMLPFILIH